MFLLSFVFNGLNRRNEPEISTSKKTVSEHTYLLHNRHGPMLVLLCLPAGENIFESLLWLAISNSWKKQTKKIVMASQQKMLKLAGTA